MSNEPRINTFQDQGFALVPGLFTSEEIEFYKQHFEAMRLRETTKQNKSLSDTRVSDPDDPLYHYPRLMQPHRRDQASLDFLLDSRIRYWLTAFLGREPFAVQTMFYFKPPGARGQALHQDQYYLRVQPGTCIAAWLAVDDCDEENGCLQIVPGSHDWPLLCTTEADTSISFTDVTVELPADVQPVPVPMRAGDVLFFNGQLVHGSFPNQSKDRFRRSLIAHYIAGEAEKVYKWYFPVLRMDGTEVQLDKSEVGGTCGTWVDQSGTPALEMQVEIVNTRIFR